jgi:hypothetical protein
MLQRFGSCGTEAKEKSEFKPPLQVAALCVPVCFNWRCSRCHCHSKSELGVETLRVELMTGEVVGIEVFIAPTWTSKYIGLEMYSRKMVEISKLRSCGLEGRTHCDGFAELARLFETFGRDAKVNKKFRMHTDKLGRTYRYVICEIEDRYVDVGPGQVRGRREIGRLREQQDNITGGIWYGKGKSAGSVPA